MVGFCHGGNLLGNHVKHDDDDDEDDDEDDEIPTMTKTHHGENLSVMNMVGICR